MEHYHISHQDKYILLNSTFVIHSYVTLEALLAFCSLLHFNGLLVVKIKSDNVYKVPIIVLVT